MRVSVLKFFSIAKHQKIEDKKGWWAGLGRQRLVLSEENLLEKAHPLPTPSYIHPRVSWNATDKDIRKVMTNAARTYKIQKNGSQTINTQARMWNTPIVSKLDSDDFCSVYPHYSLESLAP